MGVEGGIEDSGLSGVGCVGVEVGIQNSQNKSTNFGVSDTRTDAILCRRVSASLEYFKPLFASLRHAEKTLKSPQRTLISQKTSFYTLEMNRVKDCDTARC